MHRFSAILFDLGNTLVYRIVTQERTLRLLCEELRVPLKSNPDWPGAVAIWRAYHASHYLSCRTADREDALIRREARLILDHVAADGYAPDLTERLSRGLGQATRWWGVYDDVPPVLNFLKSMGLKSAIISNWEPSLAGFCGQMGLTHAFDSIISSVAEGVEKPSPRIFEIAMERLGVSAEEAVYVGDDYRLDIVGARAAGLTPVLLDRNDRYLATDCVKVRRLDEVMDLVLGHLDPGATAEVCFSGFSL